MSKFRIEDHPVVLLRPRLSFPYSWVGHIPFAYLLIDLLRPQQLVELGTDSGNSYLAFCQAIEHLDAPTQAVAIDSWQGDEHARFYGDSVYDALRSYHDPRFSGFSRLKRSWFDDAVAAFENGSIDVLHIDGLHTYEAVRHDFETWKPKLSERAVVIFHDSAVDGRGFGVRQFIDELCEDYRCFEFLHSNGLAVVEVGAHVPEKFKDFLTFAIENEGVVRRYFQAIASTLLDEETGTPVLARAEPVPVEFRLYFRKADGVYSEAESFIRGGVDHGVATFEFTFSAGQQPRFVRLDPANTPCVVGLRHARLVQQERIVELTSPERIGHVNGELLHGQNGSWLRLVALHSDPYVELDLNGAWQGLDPESSVSLSVEVDYEVLLADSMLQPLAEVAASALDDARTESARQWGYRAMSQRLEALRGELLQLHDSQVVALRATSEVAEESFQRVLAHLNERDTWATQRELALIQRGAEADALRKAFEEDQRQRRESEAVEAARAAGLLSGMLSEQQEQLGELRSSIGELREMLLLSDQRRYSQKIKRFWLRLMR